MLDRNSPVGVLDSGIGGFSVVRQVQRLLPGEELTVHSVQGEGSAFTFTLHFCPQASDAHPKADEPASALPAGEPTIHS